MNEGNGLPRGWATVPLCELLVEAKNGFGKRRQDGGTPTIVLRLADIQGGEVCLEDVRRINATKQDLTEYALRSDDLIAIRVNGSPNLVGRLVRFADSSEPILFCDHFIRLRLRDSAFAKFIRLYGDTHAARHFVDQNKVCSAGQNTISQGSIGSMPIPIPSEGEQRRIVAKAEELFSDLDAGVTALQRVRANLKRYRAAVLKAAVEGRLTAEWRAHINPKRPTLTQDTASVRTKGTRRKAGRLWGSGFVPQLMENEREAIPTNWLWAKVRDLGPDPESVVQVGPMSMKSSEFAGTGIPVLNVGSVQWGYIEESKLDYLPPEKAGAFERYRIAPGDVLFTRSGTVGRCAVAGTSQQSWLMTFHLLRVRPDPAVCIPEYLRMVFEGASHIRRQRDSGSVGSTRAGFNTNLLATLDVPLPSLEEQEQIIADVDRRVSVVAAMQETITRELKRSTRLRQSILKRAFEGKLVPQDMADKPVTVPTQSVHLPRKGNTRRGATA